MTDNENNNRFRAGQSAAKIDGIAEDVSEIKGMLRRLVDWQRSVDARLATADSERGALLHEVRYLKTRDIIGGGLAAIPGALLAVWGWLTARQ